MSNPKKSTNFLAFFATPTGRKVTFFAAGTATAGLFLSNFIPQTFGLNYYKKFMQCYFNGVEREVPEKVLVRLGKAMDKLELSRYERLLIKPFTVFGFDLFQAGSTKYRFGCVLGIPVNYAYGDAFDIKQSEIRFRNENINWNSDHGKLLQEAIVLTEDEQIFGICKSILTLQTHRVLMNSVFPSISFLMVYTVGNILNQKLNLFARPLSLRLLMYSLLGLFGLGSWSFMKDFNQVNIDVDVDKTLSSLGPEFIQAGLNYYDKQLKKNMALRALIGDDTYTSKGNENNYLRQKSLPLTIRKSYFEKQLKELSEAGAQSAPEMAQ